MPEFHEFSIQRLHDLKERVAALMDRDGDTFLHAAKKVCKADRIPDDQRGWLNKEIGRMLNESQQANSPRTRMIRDAANLQRREERRAGQSYDESDIAAA